MTKPYGRTAAKRRTDMMKIDNIVGSPIPTSGLTDARTKPHASVLMRGKQARRV